MQRPRMIATKPVLDRVAAILETDAVGRDELVALLTRTRTIFAMPLLSYNDEVAAIFSGLVAEDHAFSEATPLHFLPSVNAFALPRPKPRVVASGLHIEALGLKPKGNKPIEIAKAGLSRMQALGAAWLLRGEPEFATRGVEEMLALCKLKHWGGKQHLAVATIMQALAIGYDWLYEKIPEPDKATIRQALIDKGFKPMRLAFEANPPPNWITVPSNWNVVCNASLIMAALAIEQDTNDANIAVVKQAAVQSLSAGLQLFDADGSWKLEGPGYWHLATEHLAYLQAALDSTNDPAAAMCSSPAIANTGLYRCYMIGPSTRLFNFGDSEEQRPGLWWLRWFGTRFDKPVLHELAEDRSGIMGAAPEIHPMDILWRRAPSQHSAVPLLPSLPTARTFCEAAVLRGPWGSQTTAYVGIKGGKTSGARTHSHLDLGHFVYEVGGPRWAIDLEPDDYTDCYLAPAERYKFYRANTFGHNTLVIDGVNQAYTPGGTTTPAIGAAFSPLIETDQSTAISVDLSAAYPMAASVKRTFTLERNGSLVVTDEMSKNNGTMAVVWSMHTRALVTCKGRRARLEQTYGAAREAIVLHATLEGPANAVFQCVGAGASDPYKGCDQVEASNLGFMRLMVDLGGVTGDTRLSVRFSLLPD